jgi:hypothetical protein
MLFDASNILSFMLGVTWACLSVDHWINARFRLVFPAFEQLATLFPDLGLEFCDGLWEVLHSNTPPTIDWFLGLSSVIPENSWGIYVLVFRKGLHFKIYIGSGTSICRNGVRSRIVQHRSGFMEPAQVKKAKAEGYELVHAALLAWCPVPAARYVPVHRTALIAIEAAFHLIFWPMLNPKTAYCFPEGPWERLSLPYGGLCSHNPLIEGVLEGVDDIEFTAEQLEHLEAVRTSHKREWRNAYDKKLRANPPPGYLDKRLSTSRNYQPVANAKRLADVAAKRFYCADCKYSGGSASMLKRHLASRLHKDTVEDGFGLYCEPCKYQAKERNIMRRHRSSALHTRRCKAAKGQTRCLCSMTLMFQHPYDQR